MTPEKQISDSAFDDASRFVIKLGEIAHGYGPTATRLEAYLKRVIEALGYRGNFMVTPTEITYAIWKPGETFQRMHLSVVPGGGKDMTKLSLVGDLVDRVVVGEIDIAEATSQLETIGKTPEPFGLPANAVGYLLCGLAFAVILSGGWEDVALAGFLSLVVFGIVVISEKTGGRAAAWAPLTSALAAGFLSTAMKVVLPEISIVAVTLSAIIILIPGFSVSLGIEELTSNHVVSGMLNLMNGLVYMVQQIAGAFIGFSLADRIWLIPTLAASPVSPHWQWVFMPLLFVGLCIVFQTPPRDFLWAFLCCGLTYLGVTFGSAMGGGNLGTLLGAIVAGVFANTWTRKTGRPISIVQLPAVIVLVGGAIGFQGLASMVVGQTSTGIEQFLSMFVIGLLIAAGMLVANTIVKPERTL